jgi:hypothetical protein
VGLDAARGGHLGAAASIGHARQYCRRGRAQSRLARSFLEHKHTSADHFSGRRP